MEYPGYGIFKDEKADCETLQTNAQLVFDFVVQHLGFDPKDVILFGRSMGSGPACHLASTMKPAALILLSPYTSLKDAVKTLVGKLPALLVRDRFKNSEAISKVLSPTLIVHGQSDQLIPYSHSQALHELCGGPSKLIMPRKMTHNEFDMQRDLFEPIKQFLVESNIVTSCVKGQPQRIKDKYFFPPRQVRERGHRSDLKELQAQNLMKKTKSTPSLVPQLMIKKSSINTEE